MNAICHCGTATHTPHETATHGCQRFITEAPIPAPNHPELGCAMWTVDGDTITDYTLRHQRGYHQHENGQWSRWAGSTNSLPDNT